MQMVLVIMNVLRGVMSNDRTMKPITITTTDKGMIRNGLCVLKKKDAKECLTCKNCLHVTSMIMGQPKRVICKGYIEKDDINDTKIQG